MLFEYWKLKEIFETSNLGGVEPYSTSKAMCEQLINFYQLYHKKKIKFAMSSVRAGNDWGW